jgi:pentose-5-phosphate-3-epimerase
VQVFTATEIARLIGAMDILKNNERASKLRKDIKKYDPVNTGIDLEDLGIAREAIKQAGDAIFDALVAVSVYLKDDRVDKATDEWVESMNAD